MTLGRSATALPPAFRLSAIFMLAAAVLCLAFVPLTEGRFGPDARSHVEAGGTTIHHAHDSSHCIACATRNLLSTARPSVHAEILSVKVADLVASVRDFQFDSLREFTSRPRAPPVSQA